MDANPLDALAGKFPDLAESSLMQYRRDWAIFSDWCSESGLDPLHMSSDEIIRYLAWAARQKNRKGEARYSPSTITRFMVSINAVYHSNGLPRPGRDRSVSAMLATIRGKPRGEDYWKVDPDLLIRGLEQVEDDQRGRGITTYRDRLVLLLRHRYGLSYKALSALRTDHVREREGSKGFTLFLNRQTIEPSEEIIDCVPCVYFVWREIIDGAGLVGYRGGIDAYERWKGVNEHICTAQPEHALTDLHPRRRILRVINAYGHVERYPLTAHSVMQISRRYLPRNKDQQEEERTNRKKGSP